MHEVLPCHGSKRGGGSAEDFQHMRIYLADRDIQHHAWAQQGGAMRLYLADSNTAGANFAPAHEAIVKLYLADSNTVLDTALAQRDGKVARILLSYHYFKNYALDQLLEKYFLQPYPSIFLDSGGFSAFTQGETIDLAAYCTYIKRYGSLLTTYANLDVIGSAKGTFANQQRMEAEGLSPLPVFHTGEDWTYLEQYLAHYTHIALGGMVPYLAPYKRKVLMTWLLRCFKMAHGKAVYHGFGCTAWEVIKAFPWYSVDSSAWGAGFRYGKILLFDARHGRFVEAHLGNHAECYRHAHLFRELGFDPADFAVRSRNTRLKNCAVAALSYRNAEQWAERRHGVITIPERG